MNRLVIHLKNECSIYFCAASFSMKYLLFLSGFACFFLGCQTAPSPLGIAADYLPPTELLRKGVVSKYYLHFTSADGYEMSTDIRYYLYQLLANDRLEITSYNAGFEPLETSQVYFKNNQEFLEQGKQFWQKDTFVINVLEPVLLNWQGDTARLATETTFNHGTEEQLLMRQTHMVDTMIENQPAKVFYKDLERHYDYAEREDKTYEIQIQSTYLAGMGLYKQELYLETGTGNMELVEQMSRKTFLKRRASAPERIAYINPASTLDNSTQFKICDPHEWIHDYYNGNPKAGYRTGKRGLEAVFREQLAPSLFKEVSGYLTYRFVINCEGQTGRFVTEEADLDFKRKEFPGPLVQHCFEIIYNLDDWEAAVAREEAIDTYAYLTLKFSDGALIEILP